MPGRGPTPKAEARRNRTAPGRGEWTRAEAIGWQHGEIPAPPAKLSKGARDAWATWMSSWFAFFWGPEDLPGLRHLIRLYNAVERGELVRHAEMRIAMDSYGITPKGQQDRRWAPPVEEGETTDGQQPDPNTEAAGGRFAGLRVVKPA